MLVTWNHHSSDAVFRYRSHLDESAMLALCALVPLQREKLSLIRYWWCKTNNNVWEFFIM